MKKGNKKILVISVIISILVINVIYKQYCSYKTKTIYDDFIYTFEHLDRKTAEKCHLTNSLDYLEILINEKKLGNNYKININEWNAMLYGDKGRIVCEVTVDFYGNDNKVIFSNCLISRSGIFNLKRNGTLWSINDITIIP